MLFHCLWICRLGLESKKQISQVARRGPKATISMTSCAPGNPQGNQRCKYHLNHILQIKWARVIKSQMSDECQAQKHKLLNGFAQQDDSNDTSQLVWVIQATFCCSLKAYPLFILTQMKGNPKSYWNRNNEHFFMAWPNSLLLLFSNRVRYSSWIGELSLSTSSQMWEFMDMGQSYKVSESRTKFRQRVICKTFQTVEAKPSTFARPLPPVK